MANTRARQDPELLRALKAGADRGGQARTWPEVAALRGITPEHAMRVAVGRPANMPPQLVIDPRTIVPQLTGILTDEDVERWNRDPRCLCGCGEPCLQEGGNKGKVPYGAYRLFRGAHEKRMPWVREKQLILNQDQERRRRSSLTQRRQSIHAATIAEMILEWRAYGNGTLVDLARRSTVSEHHIRELAHGRIKRIQKLTAAKLLVAMGEPLRPEIAQAYEKWVQLRA